MIDQDKILEELKSAIDGVDDDSLFLRRVEIQDQIKAPRWVINGVIPEGVGIIAGSGGVGKTSSIVPLALAVAGFRSPECDIEVEQTRQVVFVTEDDSQINLILNGMRSRLKWSDQTWQELKKRFHIFRSKKISHEKIISLLKESYFFADTENQISFPLIIFDTASANFDLSNENDNSEVSKYMARIKEFHSDCGASVWIIAHLTKTSKGLSVDELINLSARGGGAWGDDAMWTAVLSSNEKDNKGDRVLKIVKRRVNLISDEIVFTSIEDVLHGENRFGEIVEVNYFYTTPKMSVEVKRKKEKIVRRDNLIKDKIADLVQSLPYPSSNDIFQASGLKRADCLKVINQMILNFELIKEPLPSNIAKKGRIDYLKIGNLEVI